IPGFEEGEGAGDVRRGHGGAAEGVVARVGTVVGRADFVAGGGEVDGTAEVGGGREGVGAGGGGDDHEIIELIVRGVGGNGVVVGSFVARGDDNDDAGVAGGAQGEAFE